MYLKELGEARKSKSLLDPCAQGILRDSDRILELALH